MATQTCSVISISLKSYCVKAVKVRWAGYVTHMGEAWKHAVLRLENRAHVGERGIIWEDTLKMDI